MPSDTVIRELFRSLENSIHERLRMIEDVIQLGRQPFEAEGDAMPGSVAEKLASIEEMMTNISSRLTVLESGQGDASTSAGPGADTVHVNRIGIQPQGLWVNAMKGLEIVLEPAASSAASVTNEEMEVDVAAEEDEEEDAVIEVVEEEAAEEAEAVAETEAVEEAEEAEVEAEAVAEAEEAEEAEAEEEEAVELEEFQFKNTTYYRDSENQVYGLDGDGELKEEPIGTWDVARQRVLFKRVS